MTHALQAQESYRFLMLADAYLSACPDEHEIRLLAAREYLKLGLVMPAHELLDAEDAMTALPQELCAVRDSLASVSGGSVSWSDRHDRYEANLAALSGRGVDVAPIREAWDNRRSSFGLFHDVQGSDQVRMRDAGGRWRWIPMLQHHRSADGARPLPTLSNKDVPAPMLFEGLDLGWYFERVYRATKDTFLGYSCALYVVEPDPALVALVLHLHDWRELLADPRVLLFVGDGCTDRLARVWDDDLDLALPYQGFSLSQFRPVCEPSAVSVTQEATDRRDEHIEASLAELNERYAARDADYWADRFADALSGQGGPLRIIAAVSRHTTFMRHSMRDTKRALEAFGHRCEVLTERSDHAVIGALTYHRVIRELDADLFLNIDHLRPEFKGLLPTNLPVLTWDQDMLPQVFTEKNMRGVAPHDFIVGCAKPNWVRAGFNPEQFLHARVPTCPEQFGGAPLTEEELARYGCDVSYVSHASQTIQAFHEEERGHYEDGNAVRLLDMIFELLPPVVARFHVPTGHVLVGVLEDAARRCGVEIPQGQLRERVLWWYMWRLTDRIFRHEALGWVGDWARKQGRSFRIYGRGWEEHPALGEFAAGPADNGRELLCVYRASKINLQLMPAGFIHQRALDGLASGGFFLTRYIPQDVRGRALRQLQKRIGELGIGDPHTLLRSDDEQIHRQLGAFLQGWSEASVQNPEGLWQLIFISGELEFPDEAFPHYDEILFDSSERFAEIADRFIEDEPLRRNRIDEMRDVVIEQFSYQPTVDRFLHAMADYLRKVNA